MYQRRPGSGSGGPELGMGVFTPPPKRRGGAGRTQALALLLLLLVSLVIFYPRLAAWLAGRAAGGGSSGGGAASLAGGAVGAGPDFGPVLVSYSYFEKDPVQVGREGGCCRGGWRRPRQLGAVCMLSPCPLPSRLAAATLAAALQPACRPACADLPCAPNQCHSPSSCSPAARKL